MWQGPHGKEMTASFRKTMRNWGLQSTNGLQGGESSQQLCGLYKVNPSPLGLSRGSIALVTREECLFTREDIKFHNKTPTWQVQNEIQRVEGKREKKEFGNSKNLSTCPRHYDSPSCFRSCFPFVASMTDFLSIFPIS